MFERHLSQIFQKGWGRVYPLNRINGNLVAVVFQNILNRTLCNFSQNILNRALCVLLLYDNQISVFVVRIFMPFHFVFMHDIVCLINHIDFAFFTRVGMGQLHPRSLKTILHNISLKKSSLKTRQYA